MSENIEVLNKRKSCDISDSETQNKQAKMTQQYKTPISILYEMCMKNNTKPQLTDLESESPEIPSYLRSHEKRFWVKCVALGKTAIDGGPTKKSAQHASAQLILKKYKLGSDDDEDEEVEIVEKGDYVTELMNLCVQMNYHKPVFMCIESYGPSHDPCFTFECRLSGVVRRATANNKNQSKQMAAREVYEIMKLSYPDIEKKVAIINESNLVRDEAHKRITTYLKLKELGKVDSMGTTISDRSMYLANHVQQDFIDALKIILKREIDIGQKYDELVEELNKKWECKTGDFLESSETNLKQFECLIEFDQFTVFLIASEGELKKKVVDYFCDMLCISAKCK